MSEFLNFQDVPVIALDELVQSGDIELGRGNIISKIDIRAVSGLYPIYSSSSKNNGMMGRYGKFMFDEEMVTWSVDGGGTFFYRPRHKFSVTNVSGYMRANQEKFDYKFLHSVLDYQHSFLNFDYQSKAHPSVIRELYEIPIPPLPEQKKIASILTSVDKVIENTQKQIDKLQELKNATMNELLTKGIGHTDFKDSKLGQIPKSWKVCSLGELGQIIDPHPSHRAPPEVNDGIPFLGIGDLKENGEIDTSKVRLVAREEILEHEKRYQISENTIGFGRVASIGKIIDFPKELKNVLISPTLAVIEPHSVQKKFLVNYLKSQLIINQLNFLITGSTRSSLGIQLLRELSIFLPPLPEQKEIASILTSMDRNIEEKQHKLLQIQSLKKSLMQDLLTGKVRVTVS
tara:strand:+ start:24 stop:1229 length:1206 start_codon:yes stop_codon:yes gene_type:complete